MYELTYVKTIGIESFKPISTIECEKHPNLKSAMDALRELKSKPTNEVNSIFLVDGNKEFVILNGKEL